MFSGFFDVLENHSSLLSCLQTNFFLYTCLWNHILVAKKISLHITQIHCTCIKSYKSIFILNWCIWPAMEPSIYISRSKINKFKVINMSGTCVLILYKVPKLGLQWAFLIRIFLISLYAISGIKFSQVHPCLLTKMNQTLLLAFFCIEMSSLFK